MQSTEQHYYRETEDHDQKGERRVLTRKRTKMWNYLTHRYFVVDYVCCANKCNQK